MIFYSANKEYLHHYQTSMMKLLAVGYFCKKNFIRDTSQGRKYAIDNLYRNN